MSHKDLGYYLSLSYPIELRQNPEHGGFFMSHPDLEGCMAEGGSAEEAIANLADSRELLINTILAEHVGGVTYQAGMGELLEEMRSTLEELRAQALPSPAPRRHAR